MAGVTAARVGPSGLQYAPMQDLRDALRALRGTPVVTAATILSLALVIGANTTIFSLLNAIALRPLPIAQPERLVLIASGAPDRPTTTWLQSIWHEVRDRKVIDLGFAWYWSRFDTAVGGERDFVDGLVVGGQAFESLGLQPAFGRLLSPTDESSRARVAVISHRYWMTRLGGSTDVLGRSVTLDRRPFTIVGVTPRAFSGLDVGLPFDIAVPMDGGRAPGVDLLSAPYVTIMGRLKPGQTLQELTTTLRGVQPQIRAATNPYSVSPYREEYLKDSWVARSGATGESFLRRRYAQPLRTLQVAAGAVLVIACGNIAMLLLARALGRRREFGLRAALGASRTRLARQLALESLIVATAGTCLGLVLANWCAAVIVASLSTEAYSIALDLAPDWRVFAFTTGVGGAVTLLFGIVPTWVAARTDPLNALRARPTSSAHGFGFGTVTILIQVTLAVVLLAGMGLFIRTFLALSQAQLGFDREKVLVVTVDRGDTEPEPHLFQRILEAVRQVPMVESADYSLATPGGNTALTPWLELPDGTKLPQGPSGVYGNRVGPEWFRALGTRVLAGRAFDAADGAASTGVAVVNEAFVSRFLDAGTAIGSRLFERASPDDPARPLQIVGVVEDAMYRLVREPAPPTVYTPLSQAVSDSPQQLSLSVRPRGPLAAVSRQQLATAVADADPSVSLTFRSLSDQIRAQFTQQRLVATMTTLFGAVALLLSAVGLYGLTAYEATQRRFELGVRLALGATRSRVVRMLVKRLATPVVGGLALGIVGAQWAGQLVGGLLFGVEPGDSATLTAACVALGAVAALAVWLPARRAARDDLARLLRET